MKRILWAILALVTSANAAYSQTCWTIGTDGSIELNPERIVLPYSDHIEMSGEQVSCVLRWMVDEKACSARKDRWFSRCFAVSLMTRTPACFTGWYGRHVAGRDQLPCPSAAFH